MPAETDKVTCPECGYLIGKSAYKSRHKGSKKCKLYQHMNKIDQ